MGWRRVTCIGSGSSLGGLARLIGLSSANRGEESAIGLRPIQIGIGRAGVPRVGFARLAFACGRHVIDMLEVLDSHSADSGLDDDVHADQGDVALRAGDLAGGEALCDIDDIGVRTT